MKVLDCPCTACGRTCGQPVDDPSVFQICGLCRAGLHSSDGPFPKPTFRVLD